MNRILAGGFGMTLGLLSSTGRADDNVNWHAPRDSQPAGNRFGIVLTLRQEKPPAPARLPPPTAVEQPPAGLGAPSIIDVSPAPTGGYTIPPIGEYHPPVAPTGEPTWYPAAPERRSKVEFTGEYLLWWIKQPNAGPPLLTTSPPNGANGIPGAVPGSTVLLNAGDLGNSFHDGFRLGLTYWLGDDHDVGFDGRIFFLPGRKDSFLATSGQFPNGLFRPFFAANPIVPGGPPLGEFSELISGGGRANGSFTADSQTAFWGAEANLRLNLCRPCDCSCGPTWRADLFGGFRYLDLRESLTLTEDETLTMPSGFPGEGVGTRIFNRERFATYNDFYGGQLGTVLGYRNNRWTADLRAAIALGDTHQQLQISGSQMRTLAPSGQTITLPGGLFALPSNIGTFNRDVFAVAPEVGLNLGYQVTDHLRAFVGYNFLYWSNVIRPGDQIDRVLDVNQIPRFAPAPLPPVSTPRPLPLFHDTDFWAQGVNLGMEIKW